MFSLIFASRCKLLIGRKKKLKYRCGLGEGGFGIWSTLVILLYTERENHESHGVYATTVLGRGWDEERRYSARIPPRRRRRVSRIDGRKREKNGSKVAVVGLLGSLTVGQMRAPHQGRTKNLLNIAISPPFLSAFSPFRAIVIINHECYRNRWEKYLDRRGYEGKIFDSMVDFVREIIHG